MRAWMAGRRRLLVLLLAAVLIGATFFHPRWPVPQRTYRMSFVLDITQSMNTQDYHIENLPPDRLGFAKESVRRVIRDLPCGSEVGLGLYTTQSVNPMFAPIEVCEHLPIIEDVLSHIDWRMAWAADSFIAQGLYGAVRDIGAHEPGTHLVFLSDGQETPPMTVKPRFTSKPGEIRGAIVGVGGLRPTVVPRYDREGHFIGYWENIDIEPPPVSSTDYEEKLEAPILPREGHYLSWLDEAHLKELAAITGLRYHRLESPEGLSRFLRSAEFAEYRSAPADLRPVAGFAALLLLLAVFWIEPRRLRP